MESKKMKILQNKTPVQLLHEKLARCGSSARYELVYDWTTRPVNVPKFTWEIKVGDQTAFGTDNNKKKAKQEAARNMLMQLSDDVDMLTALPANTGENMQNHIGNLSMFCSRNELPQPKYDEDLEDGPAHKRRFYWNCVVGQHREVGVAHSTKAAKQLAAQAMYLTLVASMNNPNDADVPDYKLSTETMTLCKIEKSEKYEPEDAEEMEISGNDNYSPASPDPVDYAITSADSVPMRSPGKRERTDDNSNSENEDCDNLNNSVIARSDDLPVVKRRRSTSFSSDETLVKYNPGLSSFNDMSSPASPEGYDRGEHVIDQMHEETRHPEEFEESSRRQASDEDNHHLASEESRHPEEFEEYSRRQASEDYNRLQQFEQYHRLEASGDYIPLQVFEESRHPEKFEESCHSEEFEESRHSEEFEASRHSEEFEESRHPEAFEESRHPEAFEASRHPEEFEESRHPEAFEESRHPEAFEESRHPEAFEESRHPEAFEASRHPEELEESRHPEAFEASRHSEEFEDSRHSEDFEESRHSEEFEASRHSEDFEESRHPEAFEESRHPEEFEDSRHLEDFEESRHSEEFEASRHSEDYEESRHSEDFEESRHLEDFEESRHSEEFEASRHSEDFEESRHSEEFEASRHSEDFEASRHSEDFEESRHPEAFEESRHPEEFEDSRHLEDFEESRHSEEFEASRHSEDYEESRHSEDFEESRHLEDFEESRHSEEFEASRHSEDFEESRHSEEFEASRHSEDFEASRHSEEFEASRHSEEFEEYSRHQASEESRHRQELEEYNRRQAFEEFRHRQELEEYNRRQAAEEFRRRQELEEYNRRQAAEEFRRRQELEEYNRRQAAEDYNRRQQFEQYRHLQASGNYITVQIPQQYIPLQVPEENRRHQTFEEYMRPQAFAGDFVSDMYQISPVPGLPQGVVRIQRYYPRKEESETIRVIDYAQRVEAARMQAHASNYSWMAGRPYDPRAPENISNINIQGPEIQPNLQHNIPMGYFNCSTPHPIQVAADSSTHPAFGSYRGQGNMIYAHSFGDFQRYHEGKYLDHTIHIDDDRSTATTSPAPISNNDEDGTEASNLSSMDVRSVTSENMEQSSESSTILEETDLSFDSRSDVNFREHFAEDMECGADDISADTESDSELSVDALSEDDDEVLDRPGDDKAIYERGRLIVKTGNWVFEFEDIYDEDKGHFLLYLICARDRDDLEGEYRDETIDERSLSSENDEEMSEISSSSSEDEGERSSDYSEMGSDYSEMGSDGSEMESNGSEMESNGSEMESDNSEMESDDSEVGSDDLEVGSDDTESVDDEQISLENNEPGDRKISEFYYSVLAKHGVDLKPTICKHVISLLHLMMAKNITKKPEVAVRAMKSLRHILAIIDLHLAAVMVKKWDGEYLVVAHIDSMSRIIEMKRHRNVHVAIRDVLFNVLIRLNALLR
ncbi:uncharacterized protein LOC135172883 isoform X1 [Diachasmimorpha longicaudata]|uniref:uncharacterized protein LOC135172883 isoform X1 n=1 Tax=Diachasmimorpha longicaudata TaxID=58733 RepID=UPI0030B91B1C